MICRNNGKAHEEEQLLAYYYVSWKLVFPDHLKDIGLPFDDAYALAVQMRGR